MLDPEIPEERREQIASEARKRIESGGSLKHDTAWGMRKLAYEIQQRTEADYRFFRFETEGGLLDDLKHNLRIADGVLRFRVFKVDARSPAIVPPALATTAATSARGGRRPQGAPAREPAAAEAAESAQGDGESRRSRARGRGSAGRRPARGRGSRPPPSRRGARCRRRPGGGAPAGWRAGLRARSHGVERPLKPLVASFLAVRGARRRRSRP